MIAAQRPARKLEQQLRATILLILPDCKVCGKRMDGKFLRNWNDRQVCKPCITELTAEVSEDVYSYSK